MYAARVSDDDDIAAFHRSAAARDKRILIIGGAIAIAAGAIALVLGITMETPVGAERSNGKVIALGVVLLVAGLAAVGKALAGQRDA